MTPEEVWREAKREYNRPVCRHLSVKNQAAISVIRTAMEAYAAEKVAEERAAIVAWLGFSFKPGGMDGRDLLDCIARDIAANQHHGGSNVDA